MATGGINLLTLRDYILFNLEGQRFHSAASTTYADTLLFNWLDDAQRYLQNELRIVLTLDSEQDITSGAGTIPDGCLGTSIQRIEYENDEGYWVPLSRVSYPEILNYWANSFAYDIPEYWAINDVSPRTIAFGPSSSCSGTVRIVYRGLPTKLERIWQPTTVTASVTNASASVTLSSSGAGYCANNDEVGVVIVTGQTPRTWYKVSTISTTSVTLAEAYAGTTSASATFATAQVPLIERMYPGKWGYALAHYALAQAYMGSDDASFAKYWALVEQFVAKFRKDETGTRGYSFAPQYDAPFLRDAG